MASKSNIMAAIESKIGSSYSSWRIGLTHDLAERKKHWSETEGKNVTYWTAWTGRFAV